MHSNRRHPELREGEIFLINLIIDPESKKDETGWYENIPFQSKRLGDQAYQTGGEPLENKWKPLFVNEEDFKTTLSRKSSS